MLESLLDWQNGHMIQTTIINSRRYIVSLFVYFLVLLVPIKTFAYCDTTLISGVYSNDSLIVTISNYSSDTLYLFDSYLRDNLYESDVLHRFDKHNKVFKTSFLPLINYLTPKRQLCLIVLGNERLIRPNQIAYSFIEIPPFSSIKISMQKEIIFSEYYIKDFDTETSVKRKKLKTKYYRKRQEPVLIEFAIYKHIDKIIDALKFYYGGGMIQAKSYNTISIMVYDWL